MAFLKDECIRVPLSERIVSACEPFSCGNSDLDEFFSTKEREKRHRNIAGDGPSRTSGTRPLSPLPIAFQAYFKPSDCID